MRSRFPGIGPWSLPEAARPGAAAARHSRGWNQPSHAPATVPAPREPPSLPRASSLVLSGPRRAPLAVQPAGSPPTERLSLPELLPGHQDFSHAFQLSLVRPATPAGVAVAATAAAAAAAALLHAPDRAAATLPLPSRRVPGVRIRLPSPKPPRPSLFLAAPWLRRDWLVRESLQAG